MYVRYVFLACLYRRNKSVRNPMGTLMNQNFNTIKMPQANQPKVGFHQSLKSLSCGATPTKKHISYNKYDDRVLETEQRLMKKFNCGYSSLHKMLVLKEGSNQFSTPYL